MFRRPVESGVAYGQGYSVCHHSVSAQSHGNGFAQSVDDYFGFFGGFYIASGCRAVGNAFGFVAFVIAFDFFRFHAFCGVYHIVCNHAELIAQRFAVGVCKLAYRADIEFLQFFGRVSAYHNHLARRHIPYDRHIMFFVEHGGGVGLFEIASEFRKRFGEGNAHGYGESHFFFDGFAQGVRNGFSVAEKPFATRDVKPAFVYSETFHSVRKRRVDVKDLFRVFDVLVKMGRNEHYIGAFLFCRPQRFARLNARFFRNLIFCKHDAVSCFWVSANGKRHPVVFGMQFLLYGSVEVVQVAMQNCSSHNLIIYDFVLQNKRL